MARSIRQSKILELISQKEIETQEELAKELKALNFEITQATISRDIKELGLIKILSDSKKYKYVYVDNSKQSLSNKFIGIFKESVISIKAVNNLVVVKTLKGIAGAISSFIDKLNYDLVMGCVFGDDTVMVICTSNTDALLTEKKLNDLL